jgi:hypothetical protein
MDHHMGTGSPLIGYSRFSIAQLNRSHPYSSRWATVAFYLEQETPPAKERVLPLSERPLERVSKLLARERQNKAGHDCLWRIRRLKCMNFVNPF